MKKACKRSSLFILVLIIVLVPFIMLNAETTDSITSIEKPVEQPFYDINTVSNDSIISYTLELRIQPDFSIQAVSTIVFKNLDPTPQTNFIFGINKTVDSPFAYDPFGSLSFVPTVFEDSLTMNISLRYPLAQEQMCVLSVSFELAVIYILSEDYDILQFPLRHYRSINDFEFIIYLPINYDLALNESVYPVLPTDATRRIESGLVKIIWDHGFVQGNFEYFYQISFKEVDYIIVPTTIVEIPNFVYVLMALTFILGVTLATFVSVYIFKRKYQPSKTSLVSSLLSESEQAVIQAINDEGGMAIQKQICERTGYSKSKVSQILLKLEEKDVLKRERWGRTNRVTITNESFKKIELDVPEPEKKDDDW